METLEMTPPRTEAETLPRISRSPEPTLSFIPQGIEEPLWKSLFGNLDEFFFPKKQPPLVLTSKPIPVKDIWGFYDNKRSGALGSTVVHIVLLAIIIGLTILARRVVPQILKPKETFTLIAPTEDLPLAPSKTIVGGGGGGGEHDKVQAPKGKLPKLALEQITPPTIVVRNDHPKLAVEPTVVVPPQVKIASNMPNLGDPSAAVMPSGPPSNGTGGGAGIGSGNGTGVGMGSGPGVGEGRGGGINGGVYHVGGGVSAPRAVFAPDPDYSEEARKQKYQGVCVLSLVVGPDGKPRDIRVVRTLGLGLDEKAVEAVKQWKFDPATKDHKPVSVAINVEVSFRLY